MTVWSHVTERETEVFPSDQPGNGLSWSHFSSELGEISLSLAHKSVCQWFTNQPVSSTRISLSVAHESVSLVHESPCQ
jgi:hypothetical protein